MALRLLLLLLLVPLVEVALLVWIARHTSILFTLGLVVFTAILGSVLVRRQGLRCWWSVRGRLERGELPAEEIVEGLLVLAAGLLLLTPGVLTDLLGAVCLLPPLRRRMAAWLMRRFRVRLSHWTAGVGQPFRDSRDDVIDVEVVRRPEADKRLP